jgi:uncharacterized membrane protein
MWWIFGLINVIVVILFALFFDKKIKGDTKWTLEDKCSFGTFLFLSLIGGYLVTLLFIGLFIYLVIDFIRYNKQ